MLTMLTMFYAFWAQHITFQPLSFSTLYVQVFGAPILLWTKLAFAICQAVLWIESLWPWWSSRCHYPFPEWIPCNNAMLFLFCLVQYCLFHNECHNTIQRLICNQRAKRSLYVYALKVNNHTLIRSIPTAISLWSNSLTWSFGGVIPLRGMCTKTYARKNGARDGTRRV